jgi:DNA replication protein DnaC
MAACPNCNGTGWKIVERDEVSGASRCACVAVERAGRLLSKCDLPPLYENSSFENFSTRDDRGLRGVVVTVAGFAREFPNTRKPGLLLMGYPGCGKTHLAVAAFRKLLAKGHEGLFFNYQHLLDSIRAGYDPSSRTTDREAYRAAMEVDILLLDDLGAQRNVTEWVEDTVTSIITYRCNHGKPLIATTNLFDPAARNAENDELAGSIPEAGSTLEQRVGERARSRLFEMCRVIRMPAISDYRLRKQSA